MAQSPPSAAFLPLPSGVPVLDVGVPNCCQMGHPSLSRMTCLTTAVFPGLAANRQETVWNNWLSWVDWPGVRWSRAGAVLFVKSPRAASSSSMSTSLTSMDTPGPFVHLDRGLFPFFKEVDVVHRSHDYCTTTITLGFRLTLCLTEDFLFSFLLMMVSYLYGYTAKGPSDDPGDGERAVVLQSIRSIRTDKLCIVHFGQRRSYKLQSLANT